MKRLFIYGLLALSGSIGFMWSCDRPESVTPSGQLQIRFDNVAGNQDLKLTTDSYKNGSGETFNVTLFNYYISNIRLRKADGTEYTVPQDSSYFLVKESDPASQLITLRNIPVGDYTSLTYLVGVDSLRNTMDISKRTGVLDPAGGHLGGMYWNWNSGYIFLKLEGNSPQITKETGNTFTYHIGLFGGYSGRTLNNLKTITVPFKGTIAQVSETKVPQVMIKADVLRVFDGPNRLSLRQYSDIAVANVSAEVAANYAQMFEFTGLKAN